MKEMPGKTIQEAFEDWSSINRLFQNNVYLNTVQLDIEYNELHIKG